jgi:hypothetical protein
LRQRKKHRHTQKQHLQTRPVQHQANIRRLFACLFAVVLLLSVLVCCPRCCSTQGSLYGTANPIWLALRFYATQGRHLHHQPRRISDISTGHKN